MGNDFPLHQTINGLIIQRNALFTVKRFNLSSNFETHTLIPRDDYQNIKENV